jgi:signal transduction histidine kinase
MVQVSLAAPRPRSDTAEPPATRERPQGSPNPMLRVFLLVAVAIVIFMAFTAYSVHQEIQGRAQLAAIKDMYFPLLQRLDANVVRLDKIQQLYIQVAITGDRDSITSASELGTQADQAFAEMVALYPGHDQTIAQLRFDLRTYQELATKASIAYLNQERAAAAPMAASMNRALANIGSRIKTFRKSSYDDFVSTLVNSQRAAQSRLVMGLALGLMNLGFMAVLVYFIHNHLKMMKLIAVQNGALQQDIASRKMMEAELLQSQRLLEAVITDVPLSIQACDIEGRIILENRAARDLFAPGAASDGPAGASILLPDRKTLVPDEDRPLARALRGEVVTNVELQIATPDGLFRTTVASARRLVGANGDCIGATAIAQDVTEQRGLERDLSQAQKLESIGQLAAGIAHEINTPTQYIGDNIRFLGETFDQLVNLVLQLAALSAAGTTDGAAPTASIADVLQAADVGYLRAEIPSAVAQALDGVERIANIVAAMKDFSHPGVERTPIDLNRAIASTITVAKNEWKYVAELATQFDPTLPFVPVMPGPFNQVVLNMIVNAAHAISDVNPEGSSRKGTITVVTRQADEWAEIEIHDTGCGIPANIVPRIFDPFFTTKAVGKGTGQGLAIAHNVIVDKHGGTIAVDSEPGVGTRFTLRLPLKVASVDSAVAA